MSRVPILLTLTACAADEPRPLVESFLQGEERPADILWVMDDSNSMAEEQARVGSGLASFLAPLDLVDLDVQVGVITTSFNYDDPNRGELIGDPPVLTSFIGMQAALQGRMVVGTGGSDKEKGLEAAAYAVSPALTTGGGWNSGFLRADATLHVIVLSDEQDCSDAGALEGRPSSACYTETDALVPVPDWIDALRSVKARRGDVSVHGIVGLESSTCDTVFVGSRYVDAAALTGGLLTDICQDDMGAPMAALGLAATGMRTAFALEGAPDPATIEVRVDGEIAAGWTYDAAGRLVTLGEMPPAGAVVEVSYLLPAEE
jgi:hypothetical protein